MVREYTSRGLLDWILATDPHWDALTNVPIIVMDFEYGKQICSSAAMVLDFYRHLIFLEGGLEDIYDPIAYNCCNWIFTMLLTEEGIILTRQERITE